MRWYLRYGLSYRDVEELLLVTDRAAALVGAIDELMPGAFHNMVQYANNRVECDHGRQSGVTLPYPTRRNRAMQGYRRRTFAPIVGRRAGM